MLTILERLVSFDTTSTQSNLEMIDYIETICKDFGAVCTRINGASKDKAGLVARFGPDVPGGIVLSGHCDVVPVTGQAWTRPSFALTREGDRLFGRGTTDMKGFLSCMLEVAQSAATSGLTRPLSLVFSYDEEIGCVGIQEMKDRLPSVLGAPRLCIVGEPTDMRVATGHKGKVALGAMCRGQNGHSALAPKFVNALYLAMDFIAELRQLQEWYEGQGAKDEEYDIPYSTFHVGKLTGGTALNIVPDKAEMTFEYRYLPEDGDAEIFTKICNIAGRVGSQYQSQFSNAEIVLERLNSYPGLDLDDASDAAMFAKALTGTVKSTKVAFGTEAGVFTELGLSTIVCGPGSMSGQGHKPDEYVDLSQLHACCAMLQNAVDTLK